MQDVTLRVFVAKLITRTVATNMNPPDQAAGPTAAGFDSQRRGSSAGSDLRPLISDLLDCGRRPRC